MEIKANKVRNWFLTINEGAECFDSVPQILANYENAEFSYILHDKDNEEQPHYHICILFKNARTFETMQRTFPGAHIEIMESKYNCFRYLLHLDDKDKFQYDISEVKQRGNNVEYYSTHDEYIKLDTESVLESIGNGSLANILDAVKLFGLKQVNTYKNLIKELLDFRELRKGVVSNTEYFALEIRYNDVCETNEKLGEKIACLYTQIDELYTQIDELTVINNHLLSQIREYEKIVNERGLI